MSDAAPRLEPRFRGFLLLRVSVGLEDLGDLQADFHVALAAARQTIDADRERVPAVGAI